MPRIWFNPITHLAGLCVLALTMVAFYGQTHRVLQDNYERSIREPSKLMFSTFALQKSADRSKVVVTMGGKALESADKLPKAPFGLDDLASFQGALIRQQAIAEQINGFYQSQKDRVLGSFSKVGDASMRIPLRTVGSLAGDLEAEIPVEQYENLGQRALDEFADSAATTILSATPYSRTNLPSLPFSGTGSAIVDRGVEGGMQHANRIPGSRAGSSLPPRARQEVNQFFATWTGHLARQLSLNTNLPAATDGNLTLNQVLAALSANFVQELESVASAETGSFWLLGKYRWWEIIFWVWFGVLVSAMIQLVPALIGSSSAGPWEPRESLVVVAKFFYAPVLALAVFFMAGQFGLGQFELEEMGRSSPAILGVAFLLGLFPNTTWRIVQELCTRVFREDLREGNPAKPQGPTPVTVSSTVSLTDGKPAYTVDDLKKNLGNHVTSILKPGDPS